MPLTTHVGDGLQRLPEPLFDYCDLLVQMGLAPERENSDECEGSDEEPVVLRGRGKGPRELEVIRSRASGPTTVKKKVKKSGASKPPLKNRKRKGIKRRNPRGKKPRFVSRPDGTLVPNTEISKSAAKEDSSDVEEDAAKGSGCDAGEGSDAGGSDADLGEGEGSGDGDANAEGAKDAAE